MIGLGIDTGGTYTDAVLFDRDSGVLLAKAKVPTIRSNMTWSIRESIKALGSEVSQANYVALSTTLATNAIVEGQGASVGLIAAAPEINRQLPPAEVRVVSGGHNVNGEPVAELDRQAAKEAALYFKGRVDAIAVSIYFSVRNPEHELQIKEIVGRITELPVVCGHELTSAFGYQERTVTVVLNARLIPIIKSLLVSVRDVLNQMGIDVPLLIVKSDGSLVDQAQALYRPVLTILSGPAASVLGALYLTGLRDGLVADIGGTTTDLALVKNSKPTFNKEGALVGEWRTRVSAANITTIGLGGDSYISWATKDGFDIGPRRVLPLAVCARENPGVIRELQEIWSDRDYRAYRSEPQDFLYITSIDITPAEDEKSLLAALQKGPKSIRRLSKECQSDPDCLPLERLENCGAIGRIGLTPTDILHATGEICLGNPEASRWGLKIMARRLGWTEAELIRGVQIRIKKMLSWKILDKAIAEELKIDDPQYCRICQELIREALGAGKMEVLNVLLSLKVPLIGVGAPAGIYLPEVSKLLGTKLVVPQHAEVANAVGAVMGSVVESAELSIRQTSDGHYILFSPWERRIFKNQEEGLAYARELGARKVKEQAEKNGAVQVAVSLSERMSCLGIKVSVSAVGAPWHA